MSLFKKSKKTVNPYAEPPYHAAWNNFGFLSLTNFKLVPFFVPSLLCFGTFAMVGGLVFLLGALVALLLAGPAVAAMYDVSYQLCREIPKHERRTFWRSYKANFGQGVATMAVQLPFIAVLLLLMLVQVEKPVWVTLCLLLGLVLLMAFSMLAFSQVALVALPLRKIWMNALMLIPVTHWRCLVPAVGQLIFLAVMYQWIDIGILLFLFSGPAVVICLSAKTLWPALEDVLLED